MYFSENSTKKVRLFAFNLFEVIVNAAGSLINYHLIEISSLSLLGSIQV